MSTIEEQIEQDLKAAEKKSGNAIMEPLRSSFKKVLALKVYQTRKIVIKETLEEIKKLINIPVMGKTRERENAIKNFQRSLTRELNIVFQERI